MTRLDDGAIRLRSGRSVWQAEDLAGPADRPRRQKAQELDVEIAIIGAGITGAFLAERFTRAGRRVAVIDRRGPATGSTTASTAMLLWELDASLLELEDRLGFAAAGHVARQCRRQVGVIGDLVSRLGLACGFCERPSLYLAGDKLDGADLREEKRIRDRLGLEGALLGEGELAAMGVLGDSALLYPGSAEADPVKLALGLMQAALARGAVMLCPATAETYETTQEGLVVHMREGDLVRARKLVLASGYEMPDFVPAARHTLATSWAMASPAGQAPSQGMPLTWEAADPYLYVRSTRDGRVIIGGEDEDLADAGADAERRERLTEEKVKTLLAKACARFPGLRGIEVDYAWSGVFGETEDSLPMIGRVPGRPNCLAAFGYGGNGITFSALAAELLEAELAGRRETDAGRYYALDRD